MQRLDITQLLISLQNLFYRMAHLSLKTRIESHQGNKGHTEIQDISKPLSENINELARNAKNSTTESLDTSSIPPQELKASTTQPHIDSRQPKVQTLRGRLNALSRLFKRGSSRVIVQPHLSEQLQLSVRDHVNISLRNARQGDIINAKLHADLASNALHELSNYMPKEEFTQFNAQIIADLHEFRDKDIYNPLTKQFINL